MATKPVKIYIRSRTGGAVHLQRKSAKSVLADCTVKSISWHVDQPW